jgi:hypothetical protein
MLGPAGLLLEPIGLDPLSIPRGTLTYRLRSGVSAGGFV